MQLTPNKERAKIAIALLYAVNIIGVLSVISSFMQWQLLTDFRDTGNISIDEANSNDVREQIIAIVYGIVYIICIVVFIQWFRRAYYNLHLRAKNLKYTEGWAAGAWFVPIFSLFAPYFIFKDLVVESERILKNLGINAPVQISMGLLGLYWTLWVIGNLIANVSFRFSRDESVESLINATLLDLVGTLITIVCGFLLISIIKKYDQIEPLLNETESEIDRIGAIEQD